MIEDPVNRGHCQRDTVTQVQVYKEPYSVLERRRLATCCTARLWVENFVGGKLILTTVSSISQKFPPTKITRYTVPAWSARLHMVVEYDIIDIPARMP